MYIRGLHFEPHYLSDEQRKEYYEEIITLAQKVYNPYPDVYKRIAFLPDTDRAVAVTEMMRTVYTVPDEFYGKIMWSLSFVADLASMVYGCSWEDITPENKTEVFEDARKYISRPKKIVTRLTGTYEEQLAKALEFEVNCGKES